MPQAEDATQELVLHVSEKTARTIRSAVDSGQFPNESAFVESTVSDFECADLTDEEFEREVLPVIKAMEANPGRALTMEQVEQHLDQLHAKFMTAS